MRPVSALGSHPMNASYSYERSQRFGELFDSRLGPLELAAPLEPRLAAVRDQFVAFLLQFLDSRLGR